jgi:aspartate carbamoyltransferase regulatory subunit
VERGDVFAVGDVSSLCETKQAITLPGKMSLIRHNVIKIADAIAKGTFEPNTTVRGLKDYRVTERVTMYLPIGVRLFILCLECGSSVLFFILVFVPPGAQFLHKI